MQAAEEDVRKFKVAGNWSMQLQPILGGEGVVCTEHANGFKKFVIREYSDGSRLRLHLWGGGDELGGNIHDHRWNFYSLVLRGGIKEILYRQSPSGISCSRFRHAAVGLSDCSSPERLEAYAESVYGEGSVYSRRAGEIHAAVPSLRGTVTLLATEAPVSDHASVFSLPGREVCQTGLVRPLSCEQFASWLRNVQLHGVGDGRVVA